MEDDIIVEKTYKPWQFKPGNPGGPGRTPGKTLKEYSREYLAKMTEEERLEFMKGLDKMDIWKMAEGNPHQSQDATLTHILPKPIDDVLKDDSVQEDQKPEEPS